MCPSRKSILGSLLPNHLFSSSILHLNNSNQSRDVGLKTSGEDGCDDVVIDSGVKGLVFEIPFANADLLKLFERDMLIELSELDLDSVGGVYAGDGGGVSFTCSESCQPNLWKRSR